MDILLGFWSFLMENQIFLAFPIILVVWLVVRGYDLGKWIRRKVKKTPPLTEEALNSEGEPDNP